MNKSLSDLLKKKQKVPPGSTIDWDDRKNRYLAAVKDLYDQIEAVLADPIRLKTVSTRRTVKPLNESYIGTYYVDDLVLVIGDEQVRFSPRGRNVVGAEGRVDVLGERAEAILILQPDSGWAFVQARQPVLQTVPFDEATFAEVLQLVMRA